MVVNFYNLRSFIGVAHNIVLHGMFCINDKLEGLLPHHAAIHNIRMW